MLLLKKQGNSTFCKVVKQKGETFWLRKSHLLCNCLVPKPENSAKPNSRTVCRFPVLPTPCAKTAKSCAFCDSLPVFLWHRALGAKGCHPDRAVGEWRDLVLAFKKAGKFYFGGTGVGVADKPRNVLCSFYVVLTGVWSWLGSQGEPRLCFFFHLFYMLPLQ